MKPACSILIADDALDSREILRELLEAEGYRVTCAANGKEALECCSESRFDLFIIDIFMPVLGGLGLLKEINVFDNAYEAIMIAGNESMEDIKKAMELGAFCYIPKPLRPPEFLAHVRRALGLVEIKQQRLEWLTTLEKKVISRSDDLDAMVRLLECQGQQLDAIVNSMGEGLFALDNRQSIVLMNRQAEVILGLRFAQCAGMEVSKALGPLACAEKLVCLIGLEQTPGVETNLLSITHPDAGVKYYSVNVRKILDEKGEPTGKVVILLDQTAQIKAEQLRTSFLSVVAHELRTPVTVIMNYLSLISGEENRDAVADMKTVCFRLARIVETLISGTRLSDASLTANMQQTPINELVELHLEKFKEEADQKNLTLTVEDRLQSPIVSTDRQFLSIALDSLIDNAVKFNQEAGAVRIGLEKRSMNGRPFISISIADQGLGISDASKAGLFEDFTQGESHLTRRFGGMGVGLFMAKRAMELLGGCITVDSVDGEGSCFTLLIPADATGAL